MKKFLLALAILAVPSTALAQDVDPDSLGDLVPALVAAVQGGQWSLVVSLALMVLVFLATKIPFIKEWLPRAALPWVSAVSAVVMSVAVTAMTSGDWLAAVLNGLVTGAAASGFWSLVGKRVLGGGESTSAGSPDESA